MATHLEEVISNLNGDLSALQPCKHKEVDTHLLLHVCGDSKSGFKQLLIVAVHTDVVVLAFCYFFNLYLQELWIEISTGENQRWLLTHLYVVTWHQMCQALPFWFALTGCDSVLMFSGQGKKMARSA